MGKVGTVRIEYIQDGHDRLGYSEITVRISQDTFRIEFGYSEDSQDTVRIRLSR